MNTIRYRFNVPPVTPVYVSIMQGETILQNVMMTSTDGLTYTVDVDIPPGNYLIVLRSMGGSVPAEGDGVFVFFPQSVSESVSLRGLLTDEQLTEKLLEAKQVTVDNQTVIEHDLSDVIAADKYAANREVTTAKGGGWGSVMKARAIPPAATGD